MRSIVWALAGLLLLLLSACTRAPEAAPSPPPSPTVTAVDESEVAEPVDEEAARLRELRAGDQFLEFAEHERAARAPYARLAWENFAPIVDGERVEWTNKAELWDSIAPRIRDEALLLGPEYRKPLWDNTNAIPNAVAVLWNEGDTSGRGHYIEFLATYLSSRDGPIERIWGFLFAYESDGSGRVLAARPAVDMPEREYSSIAEQDHEAKRAAWAWVQLQGEQA
jgi:hypothetical protein